MTYGEISLLPGSPVKFKGKSYVILDIASLDAVIAKDIESGKSERLHVSQLEEDSPIKGPSRQDLLAIEDADWVEAHRRFEIIRPLLELGSSRTAAHVRSAASACGNHAATLYRWIKAYQETGLVSSLIRSSRSDAGTPRLDPQVENIVEKCLKKYYLAEERSTPIDVWEEIKAVCLKSKLPAPHPNTIRNRIALLSEQLKLEKRMGKKAAKEKYTPLRGHFPGADYPLAVVQIDHTPMDVIVVDEETRQPIGRPNLTLAIDLFSKVIPGYYISLDPVGALSTGMCLAHAILPKEQWLASKDIATPYPVWGKMRVIHTDNAKEFRGEMIGRACNEHGMELQQRPKGEPQYGGHVERAFRTFLTKMHTLQGTTRSNVADKADYDSEGKAMMSLSALERWFAIFIVEYYHHKPHSGNNDVPPIVMYERGIFGTSDKPGVGLPGRIVDEQKLKLDFMPFEMRSVQEYGIVNDYIYYWHDALRRWIRATDPESPNKSLSFICRYDPRDLSTIFFYEPDTKNYLAVPYRDTTRAPISIWELRAAKKYLAETSKVPINEDLIFGAVGKMRAIVESEIKKTKAARRSAERAKGWAKSKEYLAPSQSPPTPPPGETDDVFAGDITPFEDIQEAS